MAIRFTVRVLLRDAESAEYDTLHLKMAEEGFSKFVKGASGTDYALPEAEYNLIGEFSAGDVLRRAKRAAKSTGRSFEVLVSPCEEPRLWSGLNEADFVEALIEAASHPSR